MIYERVVIDKVYTVTTCNQMVSTVNARKEHQNTTIHTHTIIHTYTPVIHEKTVLY